MEDIAKRLEQIDAEKEVNYGITLRKLMKSYKEQIEKESLKEEVLIEELQRIINDKALDLNTRFNAYYMLSIHYRRGEHQSKYIALVSAYGQLFNAFAYNHVAKALCKKYLYKNTGESVLLHEAIHETSKALSLLPEDPGVCITYAELIIMALDGGQEVTAEQRKKAFDMILEAMEHNAGYPKYYSMLGRLYFHEGRFDESCKQLEKAIDLETVSDKDSLLRTSQYYFYLLENKSREMGRQLDEKLKTNEKKSYEILASLDNIKSKYLELLAFFASILAFIISGISIMSKSPTFQQAAALLLIMGGVLNISFVLFRLLIDYNNNPVSYKRSGIVLGAGLVLIVCGYLLGSPLNLF